MNSVIVLIPTYKSIPSLKESISFKQCLNILSNHSICIVTHRHLDLFYYTSLMNEANVDFKIEFFDVKYFESESSYNILLLSLDFYKQFEKYNYMLIYQLDAYIFRDELALWCAKGYDIIGAPLIEDKYGVGKKYFLNDFNGGFSLRKIEYCIKLLSYKGPIIKPSKVYEITKKEFNTSFLKKTVYTLFRSLGRQNNIKYFINKNYINEDLLFTLGLHISWINSHINENESWIFPKLPNISTAINFAFERYPAYLFELNNNELPFGCHAWEKYEYETFWRKYIVAK